MKNKMYSLVLPIWLLLVASPLIWFMILSVNFLVYTLVLIIACIFFKIADIKKIYKRSIFKMLIYGIVADFVGGIILLGASKLNPDGAFTNIAYNPCSSWITVTYICICIALSAVISYFFNYKITFKNTNIEKSQKKGLALFIAIFTAPYMFFYPIENVACDTNKIDNNTDISVVDSNNIYVGNTMITRVFAESKNYTNSNFEYDNKITKVSSEIKSENKSQVLTQISANFDDSDITSYIKWAKQCSVIVFVKDNAIQTININLADENNENKIISNLVYERKDIESSYNVKLDELQNNQQKLQEVLDKIRQGE